MYLTTQNLRVRVKLGLGQSFSFPKKNLFEQTRFWKDINNMLFLRDTEKYSDSLNILTLNSIKFSYILPAQKRTAFVSLMNIMTFVVSNNPLFLFSMLVRTLTKMKHCCAYSSSY